MFNSREITDWILSKIDFDAGDTISPLKLQKLLYYCQAWHITIFDEKIINEDFEAWAHGPVLRSVYKRFAGFHYMNESIDINRIELQIPKIIKRIRKFTFRSIVCIRKQKRFISRKTHS